MSIGLTTDTDFELELEKLTGRKRESVPVVPVEESHTPEVHVPEIVDIPSKGRSEGDVNVPESLRKIIGEDAVINGRQSAISLASHFGISPSSVSAYAVGSTSTTSYNQPKSDIVAHINKSRQRAVKRASKTLNSALGSITQDKLDYTDAKDLAGIAKDMSVIIKNLEPQATPAISSEKSAPQFVIYAPQFKSENSFESIVVNE